MSRNEPRQRRDVYYSGMVQGVGFRYTARRIASRYAVTGFVKNLPDGGVRVVAEGEPGEVARFLAAVQSEMAGCISDVQETVVPATGQFTSFDIRF